MGFFKRLFGGGQENETAQLSQPDFPPAQVVAATAQPTGKTPAAVVNRVNEISWNDWHNPPPNVLIKENIKIAGVTHNNADGVSRQEILARMVRWEAVDLVREPSNTHDPNAVAIYGGMGQIGYVPKDAMTGLHKLLDAGIKTQCKITHLYGGKDGKSWGGTIDIHIIAPPESVVMVSRVVGMTGKNPDGDPRAEIAEWLEVGEGLELELEENDDGEPVVKILREGAEFGRLGKKDAAKVQQLLAEGKLLGASVSDIDEDEEERKIFIAIVEC